jgi:hypothetical protein
MQQRQIDYSSVEMQKLCERLHRSAWLSGMSVVTTEGFTAAITPKGAQKLKSLAELIVPFAPHLFGDPRPKKDFTASDFAMVMVRFNKISQELQPPDFTEAEWDHFVSLVLNFPSWERHARQTLS